MPNVSAAPKMSAEQVKDIKRYKELCLEYASTRAALKAGISRKAHELASRLITSGARMGTAEEVKNGDADFEYVPLSAEVTVRYSTTAEELLSEIERQRATIAADAIPREIKRAMVRQLKSNLDAADKRKIDVPPGFDPRAEQS